MSIAAPAKTRLVSHACEQCDGYGYVGDELLEPCGYCNGRGAVFTQLVPCPQHGLIVARNPDGGLIGKCDRCAAEAARAINRLNTTGRVDSHLAESVDAARRSTV